MGTPTKDPPERPRARRPRNEAELRAFCAGASIGFHVEPRRAIATRTAPAPRTMLAPRTGLGARSSQGQRRTRNANSAGSGDDGSGEPGEPPPAAPPQRPGDEQDRGTLGPGRRRRGDLTPAGELVPPVLEDLLERRRREDAWRALADYILADLVGTR